MEEHVKLFMYAKGESSQNEELKEIIASMRPEHIPGSVIDTMFITVKGRKYEVEEEFYADGVDYAGIEQAICAKLASPPLLEIIEIVVDMDIVHKIVTTRTSMLLDKFFQ